MSDEVGGSSLRQERSSINELTQQILESVETAEQETFLLLAVAAAVKVAQSAPKGSTEQRQAVLDGRLALRRLDELRSTSRSG